MTTKSTLATVALSLVFVAAPLSTVHAAGLTDAQISAIESVLSSFGVSTSVITTVDNILHGRSTSTTSTTTTSSTPTTSGTVITTNPLTSSSGTTTTAPSSPNPVTPPPVVTTTSTSPVITFFTATPTNLTAGKPTILSWSASNANNCAIYTLTSNAGSLLEDNISNTGTQSAVPGQTTTYQLYCNNTLNGSAISATKNIVVTVTPVSSVGGTVTTTTSNNAATLGVGQSKTVLGSTKITVALTGVTSGTATVTLGGGPNCSIGLACPAYILASQTLTLALNQSTNYGGFTVTLTSLTATTATFSITENS